MLTIISWKLFQTRGMINSITKSVLINTIIELNFVILIDLIAISITTNYMLLIAFIHYFAMKYFFTVCNLHLINHNLTTSPFIVINARPLLMIDNRDL